MSGKPKLSRSVGVSIGYAWFLTIKIGSGNLENSAMSLAQQVEAYVAVFPDGGAVTANELLHLGERGAVEAALAERTEQEKAYHIEDGIYIRPGDGYISRFPWPEHILAALTK